MKRFLSFFFIKTYNRRPTLIGLTKIGENIIRREGNIFMRIVGAKNGQQITPFKIKERLKSVICFESIPTEWSPYIIGIYKVTHTSCRYSIFFLPKIGVVSAVRI